MDVSTDPIQPFWVLNSDNYCKRISRVPAIAHFYKFHGSTGISNSYAVPDGAIDIIIGCGEEQEHISARICGPVSQVSVPGFEDGGTYFGIRLHPELLDHLGDASISDLAGHEFALESLVHDRSFLEEIASEKDFARQAALFEKQLLSSSSIRLTEESSRKLTLAIVSEIYRRGGMLKVSDLEEELHYSRRHLTRCFSATMGMDIKTFIDYVRFQHVLHGIRDGAYQKAADAAMAGNYYDQSHFQKTFRRFTGTTPGRMMRLLEEYHYNDRIILME